MTRNLQSLLIPLLVVLAGCSSRFADLCDQAASCEGGNDDDIEACIIDAEGDADVAAAHGCEDQFDAYFDCVERGAACDRSLASDPYWGSRCDAELERLYACTRPVTP